MYQRYYRSLYSYGKKFVTDDARAEDAIQDLFITLWRTRENLSSVTHIKYYLFRSLRRDIHRSENKEKRFERVDVDTVLDSPELLRQDSNLEKDEEELTQKISEVLRKLPKRQYEAILLRYFEDFSVPEISDLMGISEKTVRNTLFNAITHLRQYARFLAPFVELYMCYLLY